MIKILIADDHAIVRKGLKQILSEISDMVVAGEAADGRGRGGMDILKQLKHEKPKLPILMLSMYPEEQYAVRALKAGASGYLTKESAPDELISAIRKVSQGGKYVSSSLAEKLVVYLETDTEKPSV